MRTLVVAILLLLASGTAAIAAPAAVTIANAMFLPRTVTITVGESVTWTNTDAATHTASSDTNLFDTGPLARGQSRQVIFNAAGTFPYHCAIHPAMTGTIVVQAAVTPTPRPPTPAPTSPPPAPPPTPTRTPVPPTAPPPTPAPTAAPTASATAAPTAAPTATPTATAAPVAQPSPSPATATSTPTAVPGAPIAEGPGPAMAVAAIVLVIALGAVAVFLASRR